MKLFLGLVIAFFASTASLIAQAAQYPPRVVPQVDAKSFMGTWYEISAFPYFFERGCSQTRANYTLRPDGRIDVLNKCIRSGKEVSAQGIASVDPTSSGKLSVSFFWPFSAPYWVIDIDTNYQYAITANPNRNYLWILSRTPQMDETLYQQLVAKAAALGFDVTKLRLVQQ
jgi:apolipoprotein D and lipocalin family protein